MDSEKSRLNTAVSTSVTPINHNSDSSWQQNGTLHMVWERTERIELVKSQPKNSSAQMIVRHKEPVSVFKDFQKI